VSGLALATYGLLVGLVIGAILGVLGQWALAGRRDFQSVGAVAAGRQERLCDEEIAPHEPWPRSAMRHPFAADATLGAW
jgi:hypothetical protein